jgi:hypothetical protein
MGDLQVESRGAVVGEHGVGVLQESDQDEPRVDPEVGEAIDAHHGAKAKGHGSPDKRADPEENTNIRDEDLFTLMRSKDHRRGLEVVGEARVGALTGSVADKVHGPSEKLRLQVSTMK